MHTLVFGCPVITHNSFEWQMPEYEAIIPDKTGDFFTMNDTDSLADCISRWFETHKDKRDEVRESCFGIIDKEWNPHFQMNVLHQNLKLK